MADESHAQRVPDNVRAEMARTGRSQALLAASIGMTQQALSRRLRGDTPFTIDELTRIAAYLNVRLTDLVREAVA